MKWSQTLRRRVMKSRGDKRSVRPAGQARTDGQNSDDQSAGVGNERLTALAGAVLLVLILVELVSAAYLRTLLSVTPFVGGLLAGPLVVTLVSTFSPFFRYYARSPPFVPRARPRPLLRALAAPVG